MTTLTTQTRQALVTIENQTGESLVSVRVAHKYSDTKLKHNLAWNLAAGQSGITTFPAQPVQYHIGIATTGRDWWIVLWCDAKGDYYMTTPQNAREILDMGEKITHLIAEGLVAVGSGVVLAGPEGISKGAGLAIGAAGILISSLTNTEGTTGFKQHILRESDSNTSSPTTIVLQKNTVTFRSPSGTSTTGVSKIDSGQVNALLKQLEG